MSSYSVKILLSVIVVPVSLNAIPPTRSRTVSTAQGSDDYVETARGAFAHMKHSLYLGIPNATSTRGRALSVNNSRDTVHEELSDKESVRSHAESQALIVRGLSTSGIPGDNNVAAIKWRKGFLKDVATGQVVKEFESLDSRYVDLEVPSVNALYLAGKSGQVSVYDHRQSDKAATVVDARAPFRKLKGADVKSLTLTAMAVRKGETEVVVATKTPFSSNAYVYDVRNSEKWVSSMALPCGECSKLTTQRNLVASITDSTLGIYYTKGGDERYVHIPYSEELVGVTFVPEAHEADIYSLYVAGKSGRVWQKPIPLSTLPPEMVSTEEVYRRILSREASPKKCSSCGSPLSQKGTRESVAEHLTSDGVLYRAFPSEGGYAISRTSDGMGRIIVQQPVTSIISMTKHKSVPGNDANGCFSMLMVQDGTNVVYGSDDNEIRVVSVIEEDTDSSASASESPSHSTLDILE